MFYRVHIFGLSDLIQLLWHQEGIHLAKKIRSITENPNILPTTRTWFSEQPLLQYFPTTPVLK